MTEPSAKPRNDPSLTFGKVNVAKSVTCWDYNLEVAYKYYLNPRFWSIPLHMIMQDIGVEFMAFMYSPDKSYCVRNKCLL